MKEGPDSVAPMKAVSNFTKAAVLYILSIVAAYSSIFNANDGAAIDYEVFGEGAALVLLHSGMMSRDDMRVQIDYFSKYYQVIAIDAREQGRSSKSTSQITYELMASDVIGVLDQLQITKANLFGQSDGGVTALMVAHLFPDRVVKLMIHGAVYNYDAYPVDQRENWLNTTWNADDEEARNPDRFPGMAIEHYLLGNDGLLEFEEHIQEMSRMWATSPNLTKEDLKLIMTPSLVIVGDHYDISIPHTVEMHDALGNSELFIAPGATHFIHHEKPDLLHKVLHDFLKE